MLLGGAIAAASCGPSGGGRKVLLDGAADTGARGGAGGRGGAGVGGVGGSSGTGGTDSGAAMGGAGGGMGGMGGMGMGGMAGMGGAAATDAARADTRADSAVDAPRDTAAPRDMATSPDAAVDAAATAPDASVDAPEDAALDAPILVIDAAVDLPALDGLDDVAVSLDVPVLVDASPDAAVDAAEDAAWDTAPDMAPDMAPAISNGLRGEYFDNQDFTARRVVRIDSAINFNWDASPPDSTFTDRFSFSVRWTGKITPQVTDTYTFWPFSDDGNRVWVNGVLVAHDWSGHGRRYPDPATVPAGGTTPILLEAGKSYDIRIEFFQGPAGGAGIRLDWARTGDTTRVVVPSLVLSPPPTDLQSDMVAFWQLNETMGAVASDSSGLRHSGTLTSSAAPDWRPTGGVHQGALAFSAPQRTHVLVPSTDSLNPTGAITVSAWINSTDWNGDRRILQKGASDNQYRLYHSGGNILFHIANVGTVSRLAPAAGSGWHHVAGTYDRGTMRVYVDGDSTTLVANGAAIPASTDAVAIGAKPTSTVEGDFFTGLVDDVIVYARGLDDREIKELANAGTVVPPPPPGLIGFWTMSEGTGTTVTDSARFGHTATLLNGTAWGAGLPGKGGAVSLDGTDDHLTVADSTDLDGIGGAGVTVAAWVYKTASKAAAWAHVISRQVGTGTIEHYALGFYDDRLTFLGQTVAQVQQSTATANNQWLHIAGTFNGSESRLYVNGVLVGMTAGGSALNTSDTTPLLIGANQNNSAVGDFFTGLLDDVRIYTRALTDAEIASIAR